MSEIIFWVLFVIAAIFLFGVFRSVFKRIYLMIRLRSLKKENGAIVKYHTCPLFSLARLSSKPEITVEIGKRVYLIRLFSAKSTLRRVHFANPEYTVTVKGKLPGQGAKRMASLGVGAGLRGARFLPVNRDYYVRKVGKVRLLPKLKMPDEGQYRGKKLIPVLIFNPAPHEVTYVTEEKNRVLAAFTGDSIYGQLIFTASSFVTYADRMARHEKDEAREGINWDEYFS